jgi:circadian clock protein KaiB
MKNSDPKPKRKIRLVKTKTVKREKAGADRSEANLWHLRLYVAGQTRQSLAAFSNLKRICENHLKNRYRIEVIDLMDRPQLSKGDRILAIPTLVRKLPQPMRMIIGDLSDTERVLVGLDLRPGRPAKVR